MAPPRRPVEDGQVVFHTAFTPLSTPLAFVSPTVACCVVGNSVCLWNTADCTTEYLYTAVHSVAKLCGDPVNGLLAFCEGGTSPQVLVYATRPSPRLLYTLPGVTELELADLAFSRCGSRLYALSRASARRLRAFSAERGEPLKGCELELPLRFDKIAVYPGHKDFVALIRSSGVRLVTVRKSFETYIARLHAAAVPSDHDLSISAYAWTTRCQFLFATRQGALCALDGSTGQLLHACQVEHPITSIAVTPDHIMTTHIGNSLKFWQHDPHKSLPPDSSMLANMPLMGSEEDSGVYRLLRAVDLDGAPQPEQRLFGQVAYLQATPDFSGAVLATAEGEVWAFRLPQRLGELTDAPADDQQEGAQLPVEALQLRLLTWFHTHPVSDVALLGAGLKVCASTDEGGRLRLWRLGGRGTDAKGLRVVCFTSALTSLSPDEDGQLLLVGSDSGCVHVVSCADWKRPDVLDTLRISEAGITKISSVTHEGRCMSAAASLFDNRIAFFTVMFTDPKVHMFGFVDVLGSIDDICFHTRDFKRESVTSAKLLVVGTSSDSKLPCLWMVRAPPLDYDPAAAELKRDICPVWSSKLSAERRLDEKPTAVTSATKKAVAIGFAGGSVKVYSLPTTAGLPSLKQPATSAMESLMPHDQLVSCLHTSRDGAWLISASMDGSIRRVPVEGAKKAEMQKVLHNPYNGGVVQVCTSRDNMLVISTGGLDGIVAWSKSEAELAGLGSVEDEEEEDEEEDEEEEDHALVAEVDDRDAEAFPVWAPVSSEDRTLQAQAEADDPELNAVALAQRKALAAEVEGLRKKLRVLVDQNSGCPDLEKLERKEFCVDFEERDAIAAKTKERCDALRAQIERENVARQLIRDRLIKEFWDPMRTKGCQICSLMSKFSVSNYPERIVAQEEQGNIRKLRSLRRVEQLEAQMLQESGSPVALREDVILKTDPFTTGKEAYIVNWWPAQEPQAGSERGLLYQPFELLTNSRRRLQIHLLQSLSAEFRAAFNELFKQCQEEKKQVIEQIREKIARIRAILRELQIEEQVPEPDLQDSEDAEHVLKVTDAEIVAEKWISEEERKRLEEAAAREEERLRALREDDAGTRALQQMMGGTLKTKKDLSALEITLDKEPWMDQIPEEEMTDLQRQAFKEFQEKEKALLEEQDKYRKQLDADLKRLRSEVQEHTQHFESVLKELSHKRFAHDAKFFCQELYCVRLQLALLQSVEDSHVCRQSSQDVGAAQARLLAAEERLDAFRGEVAGARERQDERLRHEKEVSSATHFRQQFAQSGLEPEAITSLLQLFRRRQAARRQSNASPEDRRPSAQVGDISGAADGWPLEPSDPYPDLGTVAEAEAEPALEEDHLTDECPDGVDDASFRRMFELRRDRLVAELDVQRGQRVLQEMGGLLAHLQQERDDAKAEHDHLQAELAEHEALMDRELHDVEILFQLRQGQVEVPQAAVVTDYSDAIVIDQEVVESRNRRIVELGKDKVGTLGTIKEFRKRLNLLQWEHRMLELQTCDLEERTKDVHMLRVTKGLQSLLKGGEEGRNKADADLLERKIEHLNNTTQQKEASLKKQHAMGGHAARLRRMENGMLEKKLRELQQNVIQREHIRRLRAPQGGGAGGPGGREGEKPRIIGGGGRIEENEGAIRAAQATFRETRARQGLLDAARKHTEEIELLRRELDRLRQRTFPSFVQLHEDRPPNPDHAGR